MSSKGGFLTCMLGLCPFTAYFFGFFTVVSFMIEGCVAGFFSDFCFFFGGLFGVLSPIIKPPFQVFLPVSVSYQ